jgi:hypothetical protein
MSKELETLRAILAENLPEDQVCELISTLTIASGNGSVAIDGDAAGAVTVTGSQNIVGDNNHVVIHQGITAEELINILRKLQPVVSVQPVTSYDSVDKLVQQVRSHHPDDIQCLYDTMPLLSEELKQLERDLLVKKWIQANLRTRSIMLKTVQREKERWLTEEQIHEFPHRVLQIVDNFWAQASNGKLGFKQQLNILEFHDQIPHAFGKNVGWLVDDAWIKQDSQLSIDLETMPAGHLPWNVLPMITMDNAILNSFVIGLRNINKQFIQRDWQRQLIADFMAGAGWLIRDQVDKEEFKRSLEYELSQNEPWWEGDRVEEFKVKRLFALLLSHTEYL